MKNKKGSTLVILFLFSLQSLIGFTYLNLHAGERNNVDILDPEISDVIVGNYIFPGVSGPIALNESIRIGLLGDMEDNTGDHNWKGAQLAAREINEAGGLIINSTQFNVGLVAEDTNEANETMDVSKGINAANKIISYDPHSIIGGFRNEYVSAYLEPIMDVKIPFLGTGVASDEFCQEVKNNYARYKYFFRVMPLNSSKIASEMIEHLVGSIITLNATYPGELKNVTILRENLTWSVALSDALQYYLPYYVDLTTSGSVTLNPIIEYNISTSITYSEMSGIWDQVNASRAQLVIPIFSSNASIIVSKTYAAVQPKCLMEGVDVKSQINDFWDDTEGCSQYEVIYQSTYNTTKSSKTIPFWNNFVEEYNIEPFYTGIGSYEAVYMLANVTFTSQSLNSDDIVSGLEGFTSSNPFIGPSGRKAFWPSHDLVQGYPYSYGLWCQWQLDGKKVVVPSSLYPSQINTGILSLPYWGIHDLTEAQDLPESFILNSDADFNDRDGSFDLTWGISAGADYYSVFVFNENITYISKRFKVRSYEDEISPFTISGLKTGEYSCIVAAYNGTGEKLSNSVYVKVERPSPGNITLTSDNEEPVDTDGNFNLSWTIAEGADNYTLFTHDRLITQINGSVTSLVNQTTLLPFTVTSLLTGDYFYAVMAYNKTGETLSNNIQVRVRIPPGQFNLSSDAGTPDFNGAFNLTWSNSIRAENYTVYQHSSYITEINSSLIIIENQTILNSTEITGLPSGFYYYITTAYNGFNYTLSNCIKVNVRIPPGQFNLSSDAGTPDTNGAFNLTWSASISAENYTVYQHSSYITEINTSLIIIENQTILNSTEITGLPSGIYYYIITAYNGFNTTLSNCIKVEVQFYNEISGYWVLNPLSIDDMWTGDYTWGEAAALPWCSGSGTSGDPYIIEFLDINGQNSGSCLIIGNSNAYFEIRNCTFYNSGNNQHDAGLKLYSVTMGLLESLDCSSNSGNGIILDTCQDIIVTQSTINNNGRSGFVLIDCNSIEIIFNNNTINNNDLHGIYLENSNNNEIIGNRIYNNQNGIYFNSSNDNSALSNDFLNNAYNIVEENSFGNNLPGESPINPISPLPFEIILMIIIIGVAVVGSISGALVIKKRKSRPKRAKIDKKEVKLDEERKATILRVDRRKEKERQKVQKEERKIKAKERKTEDDLTKRISFVDYLIKENKIGIAIKNLLEIQEDAKAENLRDIGNKARQRIELCKELESKLEKDGVTIEGREKKIEIDIHKNLILAGNLIKENNFKMALKNLVELQKEAQAHELIDLVNEVEEQIVKCKKLEVELITRIKQTILMLATKFARLQLIDISERSSIKDEGLIENVIQDMIKNKEIHGEYFSGSKSLALDVAASLPIEEKAGLLNVFISYSTLDTDYFQISKLVRRLELYSEIKEVLFWEVDSKQNIVEFMEETLKKTNVFVLFCSEKSIKSEAVKGEWQSGYQMVKKGLMKMIPVYEEEDHIPRLLWSMLNVRFTKDDFEGFIQKLYEEIIR